MANYVRNRLLVHGPREVVAAAVDGIGPDRDGAVYAAFLASSDGPGMTAELDVEAMRDAWGSSGTDEGTRIVEAMWDELGPEARVVIEFETRWTPPVRGIACIAADYPELEFRLWGYEPGLNSEFLAVFEDGQCRVDDTRDAWCF